MLQLACRLPSLVRILVQSRLHDAVELRRRNRLEIGERPRPVLEDGGNQAGLRRAGERTLACDHLVEDQAQRVEIGTRIRLLSFELLRRHVAEGAEDRACLGQRPGAALRRHLRHARAGCGLCAEPGQAEVEQLDAGRGDHHVAGLQVPVDDAVIVRRVQRVGDLPGVLQCIVQTERAPR